MSSRQARVCSIADAVDLFAEVMDAHPERNLRSAQLAVMAGEPREHPCIDIHHDLHPDDTSKAVDEFDLPGVEVPDTPEGNLVREIMGVLEPLKMLNPIKPHFGLAGSGTLVTCFGIPLDPNAGNFPAYTKSLDQVLAEPPPDPYISGLMPRLKERIDLIKSTLPEWFSIGFLSDGPFNLAHQLIGDEAFTAPYLAPEKYHRLMDRITDFWLQARRVIVEWIGPERFDPWYYSSFNLLCECSANLISSKMYEEFVCPYDTRIANSLGAVAIHPCGAPHIFHATLEHVPNVAYTEAGIVRDVKTAAGSISVDEALQAIGDRPIALFISNDLLGGKEIEVIKRDLDLYEDNKRLLFNYGGRYWRKKDRPLIRDLHCRVDDYWYCRYSVQGQSSIPEVHRFVRKSMQSE